VSFPRLVGGCLLALALPAAANAASSEKLDINVRGRTLTLAIYQPRAEPRRGTVVMGSGDVGWVGLAVSMAETLSEQGYLVVGVNIRQYLSSFTSGASHLEITDAPGDFHTIAEFLRQKQLMTRPVILSGVSEGAAVAVLAASNQTNHAWIDGVITMGLPPRAELAWRWTDISAWFTRHEADEPSFAPAAVIRSVSPLPLFMIQSRKDEYVSEADYQRFLATAGEPKKLTLIDASNHRFTDRRQELRAAYFAGLAWIQQMLASAGRT
jgi:alpha-beta hydrolase superfamily lysophospholipase